MKKDLTKLFTRSSATNIIAYIYVLMTFAYDFCLLLVKFPHENRDLVLGVSNILNSGGLIMILSFFYGSSKMSQDKDESIKNLSSGNSQPPGSTTAALTVTTVDPITDVPAADAPAKDDDTLNS